ncbi:MAG: diguanylate cyclase [Chitinispirillaceae bacterium]|nr:diguanylate cyclase [Chitinispirillaceae bacterium]
MSSELPFNGFHEFIQKPLETTDPKSLNSIKKIFIECRHPPTNPFGILIQKLTGRIQQHKEALTSWRHILENKQALEQRLARSVNIQTAAIDYFDQRSDTKSVSRGEQLPDKMKPETGGEEWLEKIYAPGYHLEKLKEEMLRARRYKHALTTLMLDIDNFKKVNDTLTYKGGDKILILIVKILKKTIRTVDILTRYSGDRFLLILPNTNKREALELAERLRVNVQDRTKRIEGLNDGVTVTISVGQCANEETSTTFLKHLEITLENGKKQARNSVYAVN